MLPTPLSNSPTSRVISALSIAAVSLAALVLLGPSHAVVVAVAGACVYGLLNARGRLAAQAQDLDETRHLYHDTAEALSTALDSERALLDVQDRLAASLAEMTRLRELSTRLLEDNDLHAILHHVLVASIEILRADKGLVQLYDEDEGVLKVASHVGVGEEFLELFKAVPPGFSIYGAALARR